MNDVALKLIDTFGEKIKPDHINKNGDTAFIIARNNKMNDVCSKLINSFGKDINPNRCVCIIS
jgi:hypothetical protein